MRGGVGGGGGDGGEEAAKISQCHITKLKGRSGETKNRQKKDQRELLLCNMPTADRQAALVLHLP